MVPHPKTLHPLYLGLFAFALLASLIMFGETALAQSGGLYLPANGGPSNGTAQAGSGALARDAETSYLNAAGMTRLETNQLIFSVMPFSATIQFNPSSETTINGTDGGNQGGWLAGGGLFYAHPLNEKWALGFSATSPAGLVMDPTDDWVGRSYVTKSAMIALNFEPSVGFRITEQFSLGLGIDIQYLTFQQDLVSPTGALQIGIDGDSWQVGASPSLLWEPKEATRVGLRYRSEIGHSLSGDLTIVSSQQISTSFTMPQSVTFSLFQQVKPSWSLMADLGWTNWSAFDNNTISFDSGSNPVELPRNFVDTWNFSLGAHIALSEQWLLMLGGGYTSAAVEDENRTPDMPVDAQTALALGVEWNLNESWNLGANYTYTDLGTNAIDQTRLVNRRIKGDYNAYIHLFGIYGSVSF